MKKSLSIILAIICIIGLVGCGKTKNISTKNIENHSIEQNQNTTEDSNSNTSNHEEQTSIDLNKENKIIPVKTEKDIYNGLYETIKSKSNIINFDISNYDNTNKENLDIYKDTASIIDNNRYSLVYNYPELNTIERIESICDKKNNLITAKIYYYYFQNNTDIFISENINEVAAVLNRRILKKGDKTTIDLIGNNSKKYNIQCMPEDSSIVSINKNGTVTTLKAGETDINVKIISKEDNSKVYSGILKIKVLPENTAEVTNVKELRKVLTEKIGEDYVNVYVKNIDTDIIFETLQSMTSPYIFFTSNDDYTSINVQYDESKNKTLNSLKEINNKADQIINQIITPNMTDEKKIQTIYDYIINNADYDMDYYSNNKKVDFSSRTAYGILLNGKGICGGFADSLNVLLRKVGIESYAVSGNAGGDGHMWNIVKLNGEYRYFDVTFDNTYSTNEKISHEYFNITEEEISKDHEWYIERFNKFLKALE